MDKLICFILGIATGVGIYKAIDNHPMIRQSSNEELGVDGDDDEVEEKSEVTTNLDNSSADSLVN